MSEPRVYAWRNCLGALAAVNVRPLRQLEQENERLKKLGAEGALAEAAAASRAMATVDLGNLIAPLNLNPSLARLVRTKWIY